MPMMLRRQIGTPFRAGKLAEQAPHPPWARAGKFLGALLLLSLSACCASPECTPAELPSAGVPRSSEALFLLTKHAARQGCFQVLYDCLSEETRAEHSYFKLRLFLDQLRVPEPWGYALLDILKGGSLLGVFPGPAKRELVLIEYEEPQGKNLLAQILVVEEEGIKRLGLEEQVRDGPPIQQE